MQKLEKMQDILVKLREAKEARFLSYQDIVDITEQNNEAVSLSTVKRMFAKDANIADFRYNQTIRPVVRAVLGLDEDTEEPAEVPDPQQAEQYYTTIEAMKAVLNFKAEQLGEKTTEVERLRAENDRLKTELHEAREYFKKEIETIRTEAQKKVEYLKEESDRKSKVIERLLDK